MKEKVLMFGEGNFLRAFAGVIVERLNSNADFNGSIVCLQGTKNGLCDMINQQKGVYTVIERGIKNDVIIDVPQKITSISRCVNPYTEYANYLKIAENPDLELIISNTTEFGICYDNTELAGQANYSNFPAKLTDFLFRRFTFFKGAKDKGVIILPCELINRNGSTLKEIVLMYAKDFKLGTEFVGWLEDAVVFCNTLVDRIVSGYPSEEADSICEKLGYEDSLLDICEPFFLWVIETSDNRIEKIPFIESKLDVIITDDLTPYRERKVRILNGAHTMSALAGYLAGLETVEQIVADELFFSFIKKGIFTEIIPAFDGDKLKEYADDVLERFKNPFINHKCLSISLNSISKFKARLLPSIKDYIAKFSSAPKALVFSLAALYVFYKTGIGKFAKDDEKVVEELEKVKNVKAFLGSYTLWGEDLNSIPCLYSAVNLAYYAIASKGIRGAIMDVLK